MALKSGPFSPRNDRTTTHPVSTASAATIAAPRRTTAHLMRRMASRGEAEQPLQIAPEDGFLLGLREALHGEDPGDRPVERHVVRPVRAEHDPVGADGVGPGRAGPTGGRDR